MHTPAKLLKSLLAVGLFVFSLPAEGFSQWIIYNFSPRAAYLNSYGLSTNTDSNANNSRTNGWPTNWSNGNAIGYLALYFSTNTNSPNFITALPPLVFNYNTATNTNRLTTSNYVANLTSFLGLTNTNASSLSNICLFVRTRLGGGSSGQYMTAQYTLVSADTNTNTVGSFQANLTGYANPTTNTNAQGIGTNGVPVGTNFYPQMLNLKISTLSSLTSPIAATNRQLNLPLTINLPLTRIVNTNTNFSPMSASPTTNNPLYTNLPRLIRSNNTYTNAP